MKMSLTLLLVLGVILGLVSCGKQEPEIKRPRPVYSIVVDDPKEDLVRSYSGLVQAAEGTGIAFEVSGRVLKVIADDGKRYEKGDLLAELDSTEYRIQLESADAQRLEAEQRLRRTQQLFESGNASKSQLESAIASQRSAQSSYESAQKRVEDTTLEMPYSGVIGSVEIDAQQVVNAGQVVMTIQGEDGMEFEIGVPAEFISRIKPGMPSTIELGSIPDQGFEAEVKTISPQVTQNTTYPVSLSFTAEDPRVREGMDGEATLSFPNPNGQVITIPAVCVAALPEDVQYVWVIDAPEGSPTGVVSRRTVKTGKLREGNTIEILEGLKPGERVVSRGVHQVEEGQEVRLGENT